MDSWSFYIVYAPLFYGCTTILFEGKPVGTLMQEFSGELFSEHKVKSYSLHQLQLELLKKDPNGDFFKKYDLSSFEKLFLAGRKS